MRRVGYLAGGSALAIALSLGLSSTALAQDATEVEAVVVTGSLIRGTPEDAALPVDVIGAEELAKQGSPTTVDLIKGLSVSNGVLGDTNQFDSRAQGSEGSGSVNLRGLGPTRTLVLINGKRMAINPFALAGASFSGVDLASARDRWRLGQVAPPGEAAVFVLVGPGEPRGEPLPWRLADAEAWERALGDCGPVAGLWHLLG